MRVLPLLSRAQIGVICVSSPCGIAGTLRTEAWNTVSCPQSGLGEWGGVEFSPTPPDQELTPERLCDPG